MLLARSPTLGRACTSVSFTGILNVNRSFCIAPGVA